MSLGVWVSGFGASGGPQGLVRESVRAGREGGWGAGTVNRALGGKERGMKGKRWKHGEVSCPSSQRRRGLEPEGGSSLPENSRKTGWRGIHPI